MQSRLTLIGDAPRAYQRSIYGCECGAVKALRSYEVASGKIVSCGCYDRERRRTQSGMSSTGAYKAWRSARSRCHNPMNVQFSDYGGRGIEMCAKWRESFALFFADMGHQPEGLTLDRADNDGNYEPDNCRWITQIEQQRNRRSTKLTFADAVALAGEVLDGRTRTAVAKQYGLSIALISDICRSKTWVGALELAAERRKARGP